MQPEQKSNGALVGSIIIVLILIIGGIYLWRSTAENSREIENQNISNSASSLEAELDDFDLENLDSEI